MSFAREQQLTLAWENPSDFHLALVDYFPQDLSYLIDGPYFSDCLHHNDKHELKKDKTLKDRLYDHSSYMLVLPPSSSPSTPSSFLLSKSDSSSSKRPLSEDEPIGNAITHSPNSTHCDGHLDPQGSESLLIHPGQPSTSGLAAEDPSPSRGAP
ncbi:hypothetical protein PUNSTDRAFT_135361 [Punctularia strigosozonata HHB-11173 SS5]|uniref:uncharacterized protein n=1 Tax=Punctularia strigosozonata (strain HHB-11173) TaxID=741275 RepID=UPI0004416F15|nr:uncharacterized protein PUNSTDRAFT_135361 [Punctularia strigosozonata HHB-11173 SS5]EIN07843.1 hypothetical protein PUNSTDRAFT_135361 [Punctularia strigosozonata HHB-11173 SS5]